jgi:hypothetical protein
VIQKGHSVSAVITANKGKDNACANKIKQAEPLGDTQSQYSFSNLSQRKTAD